MKDDYTKQIGELNLYTRTKLAPSPIHGVGVFAIREIAKGQKLYTDIAPRMYNIPIKEHGQLFIEIQELIVQQFPQVVNGSAFVMPTTRIQAFMNHSDNPNYDAVNDVALRDIEAGDEVTEDYTKIEGWENIKPYFDI